MDTTEITNRYMEKYTELSNKLEDQKISVLIEDLNNAISQSEMDKVNKLYNQILEWNSKVDKLLGAKIALDVQYSYLRLPSPAIFSVIYDGEERLWKFNTNP
ncbi:MAG: hypothetical protein E6767_17850 [Dysgonomonas sp.]|nr:hypothetical protein [Dysgonomonas sp.]